ncbi:ABC transporter ATP-binding protein [Pseudomonas graminis]|uniref:ABC transporter ATP-binding protein n=1 Tax=Pseudomonas graminis TaxID=158627 RepID=A0A1C2EEV4_9PSED|nr:ABC transporter ATP-binding protein [Pseudomonas graminis]OCX25499.1 hypothetical protein BBI10_02085 [Pseudomonas graminis]
MKFEGAANFLKVLDFSLDSQSKRSAGLTITIVLIGSISYALVPYTLQMTINSLSVKDNHAFAMALASMLLLYSFGQILSQKGQSRALLFIIDVNRRFGVGFMGEVVKLPISVIITHGAAKIVQIMQGVRASNQSCLQSLLLVLFPTVVEVVVACSVFVALKDFLVAGLIVSYLVFYTMYSFRRIKVLSGYQKETVIQTMENARSINNFISNVETIKVFNAVKIVEEKYLAEQGKIFALWQGFYTKNLLLEVVRVTMFVGLLGSVLYVSGSRLLADQISLGHFVMVNAYLYQVCRPFESLIRALGTVAEALSGYAPFVELINPRSKMSQTSHGGTTSYPAVPLSTASQFEFKHVNFGYDSTRQLLLDFSLTLRSSDVLAVTGPSGAGKSTLVKLMSKLQLPNSGSISINGVDINTVSDSEFYDAFCVVTQDVGLFNDTLAFNLRVADPDASDSDLMRALDNACLTEVLRKLPDGLNSQIGERGLRLSGGERQRMTIARSFLRRPRIIIYDESTSSLDEATEARILKNIVRIHADKIIVLITHKASVVAYANKVLNMTDEARTLHVVKPAMIHDNV